MSKPIRVLQIVSGMQNDGVANVIMNVYRKIDRTKVQFDFLVHTLEEQYFDKEIKSLGGHIYNIADYESDNEEEYIEAVTKVFKEHGPFDIAHGHWGKSPHIYLKIAQDLGSLTVNHAHSRLENLPEKAQKRYDYIFATAVKYSNYFLACSRRAGLNKFGKDIVDNSKNYHFFPNGIENKKYKFDAKTRQEVAEEFNIKETTHVYGHVGRITQYPKNHEFLIDVFNEIVKIDPDSLLMIVGEGPDRERFEEKIEGLGLTDKVIFTGLRSDVYRLLQRMDCFLLTSFSEGLAVVAIEAVSASLPCIFSEAMPEELDLPNLIKRMFLADSKLEWAKNAINLAKLDRDPKINDVIAQKFNIDKTAAWLQNFYLEIAN